MRTDFFVIADPCIGVKDRSRVAICPVGYIQCLSCGLCASECPVGAIYPVDEVPEKWRDAIARNAAHFP